MITVGLIAELRFISKSLRTSIVSRIECGHFASPITLEIREQVLNIWYLGYHIWRESLDDDSLFGVESCDHIVKALHSLDAGNDEWIELRYIEERT